MLKAPPGLNATVCSKCSRTLASAPAASRIPRTTRQHGRWRREGGSLGGENPGELRGVSAAPGDERDRLPPLASLRSRDREGCRDGKRSRRLGDDLVPEGQALDGGLHSVLGDEGDARAKLLEQRKHLFGDVGNGDPVADGAAVDFHRPARLEAKVERGATRRLDP